MGCHAEHACHGKIPRTRNISVTPIPQRLQETAVLITEIEMFRSQESNSHAHKTGSIQWDPTISVGRSAKRVIDDAKE